MSKEEGEIFEEPTEAPNPDKLREDISSEPIVNTEERRVKRNTVNEADHHAHVPLNYVDNNRKEQLRVINSPSLGKRLMEPLSSWWPSDAFSKQLNDYRNLRDQFFMTNRYILLTGLPADFFQLSMSDIKLLVLEWTSFIAPTEIEKFKLDDSSNVIHIGYKARRVAREATHHLNSWLKRVHRARGDENYYDDSKATTSRVPLEKQFEFCSKLRYEWVGPVKATSTLWIGNLKDSYGIFHEQSLIYLLRIFRAFGVIKHYRFLPPLTCMFIAFEAVENAIKARNALFGWCIGDRGDCCINIDFSAMEEATVGGTRVSHSLRHPSSAEDPIPKYIRGADPLPALSCMESMLSPYDDSINDDGNKIKLLLASSSFWRLLKEYDIKCGGFYIPHMTNCQCNNKRSKRFSCDDERVDRDKTSAKRRRTEPLTRRNDRNTTCHGSRSLSSSHEAAYKFKRRIKYTSSESEIAPLDIKPKTNKCSEPTPNPNKTEIMKNTNTKQTIDIYKQGSFCLQSIPEYVSGNHQQKTPEKLNLNSRASLSRLQAKIKQSIDGDTHSLNHTFYWLPLIKTNEENTKLVKNLAQYLISRNRLGMSDCSDKSNISFYVIPPTAAYIDILNLNKEHVINEDDVKGLYLCMITKET